MSLLLHNLVKDTGPCLIQKDPPFDCLAAYGALAHSVSTKLTRSMATQKDHVLQAVQTDRTHSLFLDVLQLLLQLLYICIDISVVFVLLQNWNVSTWNIITGIFCTFPSAAHYERHSSLNHCPTLYTFLHQACTILTGTHMTTRLEEHCCLFVWTHYAFFNLCPRLNLFFTDEAFFHPWWAQRTRGNVATRAKQSISLHVWAHHTLF